MQRILRIAKQRIVLLNGATGTNLLDKGLQPGESPSILNVRDPGKVEVIQKAYVDAGSDIILTNTFSANLMNMKDAQLTRVLRAGACIAQKAAGRKAFVMGDIGPLGELIQPYGTFRFEEAVGIFTTIAGTLWKSGVKAFFIETFTSMIEAKAAFLAVREFSSDVFVSFSLQDNGFTIMGESPEVLARTFDALGAKGIGINCTLPEIALTAIERMCRVTALPLIAKPNAGAVHIHGTSITHSLNDKELARYYTKYVKAGANVIGGCCGTTPEYIVVLKKKHGKPIQKKSKTTVALVSPRRVFIPSDKECAVIGERMNPSGRKKVKQSLLKNDFSVYCDEAQKQERAGVDILDVNAFIVDRNETETLSNAVMEVLKSSTLPILVDTQNFRAAEQVLRFYPGIGVLNSVPARAKELRAWLPMVKQYGFKVVISLIGKKVPRTVRERMHNVQLALKIGRRIGFPSQDMIFDPLVFSAATDYDQVIITLETVRLLNKKGLKTIMGISNVSFGLPTRSCLNASLLSAAIAQGVTFVIVNPLSKEIQTTLTSCGALYHGKLAEYMTNVSIDDAGAKPADKIGKKIPIDTLINAILQGDKDKSAEYTRILINKGIQAQKIIDEHIAKALKQIGEQYESGKAFIPDLLRAANTAQHALEVIKQNLPMQKKKKTLVLATVKGDIHDIGKNIAAMIFESAGYQVIDLGKDVDAARIVQAAKKHKADVVGLSALLTTTMPEMERVIASLKKHKVPAKVIVGGPNVSDTFAKEIGAFGAASTVMQGLRLLQRIM